MRAQKVMARLGAMLARLGLGRRLAQEEQGGLTLEYVGIGAIVVALVGAVAAAMPGVGEAVVAAVTALLGQISGGGGAG